VVDAGIVAMVTETKLGLGTGVVVVGVPWDEGLDLTAVVRVDSCLEDSGITLEVATIVGGGVELESGGVGRFGYDVLTELEVAALEASTLEAATMEAAVLEAAVLEAAELEVDGGSELEIETKVEDVTGGGDSVVVVGVGVEVGVMVEAVVL
jgi:hypothetical protein